MGFKSFPGVREDQKKEYHAPILVSDYMTRSLVIFKPEQSILEVMELFVKHKISGGPVCDEKGGIVGIISEADCMKQISESRYFNMPILDKSVEKFMSTKVETIPSDMNIFDAASQFYNSHRRRLPVLDQIGRASCRERGLCWEGDGSLEKIV